jgi:hypothetical protein
MIQYIKSLFRKKGNDVEVVTPPTPEPVKTNLQVLAFSPEQAKELDRQLNRAIDIDTTIPKPKTPKTKKGAVKKSPKKKTSKGKNNG